MTVVLSAITSRENPTREVIISCGLVTWGFTYSFIPVPWMSSSTPSGGVMGGQHGGVGGGEAPILGMILGVFSAAMVAIHAVLVKSALRHVEGRALDLAYWQNAISAIALIPAILISGEVWGLLRLLSGTEGELGAFVSGSLITVSTARRGRTLWSARHSTPCRRFRATEPQFQTQTQTQTHSEPHRYRYRCGLSTCEQRSGDWPLGIGVLRLASWDWRLGIGP